MIFFSSIIILINGQGSEWVESGGWRTEKKIQLIIRELVFEGIVVENFKIADIMQ